MPAWIIELLQKNYDEEHGVVNIRPVVDAVLKESKQPFREILGTFGESSRQWHLPLVEAMRTLAATGHCTSSDATLMLDATRAVAGEVGTDEYFKTVNAMVSSKTSATALVDLIPSLLEQQDEFQRRLAFYVVGLLAERRTAGVSERLRAQLESEAAREQSPQRREQFLEVLALL